MEQCGHHRQNHGAGGDRLQQDLHWPSPVTLSHCPGVTPGYLFQFPRGFCQAAGNQKPCPGREVLSLVGGGGGGNAPVGLQGAPRTQSPWKVKGPNCQRLYSLSLLCSSLPTSSGTAKHPPPLTQSSNPLLRRKADPPSPISFPIFPKSKVRAAG